MVKITTEMSGQVRTTQGYRMELTVIFTGAGTIAADQPDKWGCVDSPLIHL
ncbi:hypothetical protein WG8_0951 [Paenibacillus sp. Aloe-11]|nr:hypothetical protein WG8_0951 [Paenibacillus sp. Aloe-11]